VLVLRTGLGRRPPRSRARVGRLLHLSARRVARIERRGERRLRRLAARGRCVPADVPAGDTAAAPAAPAGPELPLVAAAALGGGPVGSLLQGPAPSPDRIEVKGEQQSSDSAATDKNGAGVDLAPPAAPKPDAPPPAALVSRGGEGMDLTLPIVLVSMLVGIALAVEARNVARR
jgi:hypothetical protein